MIKIYCDSCKQEIEKGLEHNIDIDIRGKDCKMWYFANLCPKCKDCDSEARLKLSELNIVCP